MPKSFLWHYIQYPSPSTEDGYEEPTALWVHSAWHVVTEFLGSSYSRACCRWCSHWTLRNQCLSQNWWENLWENPSCIWQPPGVLVKLPWFPQIQPTAGTNWTWPGFWRDQNVNGQQPAVVGHFKPSSTWRIVKNTQTVGYTAPPIALIAFDCC